MDGPTQGTSLVTFVELFLSLLLVLVAFFAETTSWWQEWTWTAAFSFGGIVLSYILMFVVAAISGFIFGNDKESL